MEKTCVQFVLLHPLYMLSNKKLIHLDFYKNYSVCFRKDYMKIIIIFSLNISCSITSPYSFKIKINGESVEFYATSTSRNHVLGLRFLSASKITNLLGVRETFSLQVPIRNCINGLVNMNNSCGVQICRESLTSVGLVLYTSGIHP